MAEWRGLFLSTYPAARAQTNSLLRYGVCCRPPGSADAGFPRRRRRETHPVAKLYNMSGHSVWFSLSSVLSGRHVWRAAPYKSIQAGTHIHVKIPTCCCSASRAPPAVWNFFWEARWEGEGSSATGIEKFAAATQSTSLKINYQNIYITLILYVLLEEMCRFFQIFPSLLKHWKLFEEEHYYSVIIPTISIIVRIVRLTWNDPIVIVEDSRIMISVVKNLSISLSLYLSPVMNVTKYLYSSTGLKKLWASCTLLSFTYFTTLLLLHSDWKQIFSFSFFFF